MLPLIRRCSAGAAAIAVTILLAPLAAASEAPVTIVDPDDILNPAEEQDLTQHIAETQLPAEITGVDILITHQATEPYNDWVVSYLRDNQPQWLTADGDYFADGQLILGVATQARQFGYYVGEDVAAATGFDDHHNDVLSAMRPDFGEGNWVAGLEAGLDEIADPHDEGWLAAYLAVIAVIIAVVVTRKTGRKKAATAREQYAEIMRNYAGLAARLDEIDVRAHSLSSPLADDALRRQWDTIRVGFVGAHERLNSLPDLTNASAKRLRHYASAVSDIHEELVSTRNAERNIDKMFAMEHGDAAVRRRELGELRADMVKAQVGTDNDGRRAALESLVAKAEQLRDHPETPDFMARFADLIGDYQIVLDAVRADELTKAKDAEADVPTLGRADWHPGYGYGNFVPYFVLYNSNAQAVAAESTPATSTSFSGGFSGTGASSSF